MELKKRVVLTRLVSNEKQTLGTLSITDGETILFVCKTLELPNKDNAARVSCIPKGTYECRWTLSPRMKKMTYEVLNISNRSGIRIHSANYYHQLLGCIAFGDVLKDIDADGELDVLHSGDTLKKFEEIMKSETFKLIIK